METKVFFTTVSNKADVACFKANASSIINDAWYSDRKSNTEEESMRIVSTAPKLILNQICSSSFDMTNYPTDEMIADLIYNKEWIPELLRTFLECLTNNVLKQVSIGQALIHAARPRSSLPPILFGTAVELDHVFGSKWLLIELRRLALLELRRS